MKNIGTVDGGLISPRAFGIRPAANALVRTTDAAIANGNAMLISELEKRDTLIREPLTSFTYARDLPVKAGGGWVEFISALNLNYGVAGGSDNGLVSAPGANGDPVIQANLDKDVFKTHIYSITMRIMFVDMQRQAITGRSLEKMLTDGIRLSYDKHMDANVYIGMSKYNTTGLLNNPNVVAAPVATGQGGTTEFRGKTPAEILNDLNNAILAGWEASEWDLAAIPNHIIMPYDQFNYIATTKVTDLAEKTILTFLLENNVATKNGSELVIAATAYCKGAGAGGTDRMAVYRHDDRFLLVEELAPISRIMTSPNIEAKSYDSVYMANLSEVEIFYNQPITYWDGI